jgi:hypothetical protein
MISISIENYWIIEESLVIAIAYYMEQAVDIGYGYFNLVV